MTISVIIPTHNPRPEVLARTLAALQAQDLPLDAWELILVDNASSPSLPGDLLAWHPRGRVIAAPTLGLTPARFRGIQEADGDLLVWCDDDNLLAPDYLTQAGKTFVAEPRLGAAGGKSIPEYASPPPAW